MPVIISMLRGVNLLGHNRIKMEALRALYESLDLQGPQTCVQSGNVVFKTKGRSLPRLAKRIEDGIERSLGFRPSVILRTPAELREVIAKNPFAKREGIEPSKLLVTFLAGDPGADARHKVRQIKADPEEIHIDGREMFIYYPIGIGQSQLSMAPVERALKTPGTARNWNTVTKLLAIAEEMEASR